MSNTADHVRDKAEDPVAALKKRVRTLEKSVQAMTDKASKQEEVLRKHKKFLEVIEEHAAFSLLERFEQRLSEINKKLQILILKNCVMTEVPRLHPDSIHAVKVAMDKPDEWWRKREHMTINQWADLLSKIA